MQSDRDSITRGTVFSVQRYCLEDGPGIRTTVFLKGCPLSCPWCHNPESRDPRPELALLDGRCVRCGACVEACPEGGARPVDGEDPVDRIRCVRCGACVEVCPTGARQAVGRTVSVPELLDGILRDRPFYEETGGGVTFSGGEPLQQPDFLQEALRACRRAGVHTALDTCGHAPRDVLLAATALADLVLYDLKLADAGAHEGLTGVPLGPILDNLRALDASGPPVWIRVPVIPGVNDDVASLGAIGAIVAALPRTRRLHLLPYHASGAAKRARLGGTAPARPEAVPATASRGWLAAAAAALAAQGLDVHIGG